MGYFRDTLKGVSWMAALRVGMRLISFVRIAVLARLLLPAQFGLYGIATLVLSFLENITETGVNVFLIQEKIKLKHYIDTSWMVSIVRGMLISFVLIIFAPLIASFFKTSEARSLVYLVSVVPVIRGLINPSVVKFRQELQFNKEFLFQLSIFVVHAATAIIAAIITRSASSLVWALIISSTFEVIISHIVISPKPKIAFSKSKLRRVINRGKWVTAASIFDYLFREGDDIVVGRLLTTNLLGTYQMAYKISTLPITEVADTLSKVTFPVFSKISRERKRLRNAFVKSLALSSAIVVPFGLILFLFTEEIVLILLGPNWTDAIMVIKVLAIFGVLQALTKSIYPLFLAVKKQEYVMAITLLGIFGLALTIIPFVKTMGIVGAAYSAMVGLAFSIPLTIYYTIKTFKDIRE